MFQIELLDNLIKQANDPNQMQAKLCYKYFSCLPRILHTAKFSHSTSLLHLIHFVLLLFLELTADVFQNQSQFVAKGVQ